MKKNTPGIKFKIAVQKHTPLQIVGAMNAYCAILAEQAGHQALYISGGGVANATLGQPDLGVTHLGDVAEEVRRMANCTSLPILVDIDTGWGSVLNVGRTIKEIERSGAAAVHIEDQITFKRCGHRPNKQVVSTEEMVAKIKAAVDARQDDDFIIMARTDALAVEGMEAALERVAYYREAGADMIFPEAVGSLEQYKVFVEASQLPVLANITEFSDKTPLLSTAELATVGVHMVLYPLTIFRMMAQAAKEGYRDLIVHGHQKNLLSKMQTRKDLYHDLGYYDYEKKIDQFYQNQNNE